MIEDYQITRETSRLTKWVQTIEFILILIIIQAIVLLLTGGHVEKEAIQFRVLAHSNASVDQQVKMDIQQEIQPLIQNAVNKAQSKKELVYNLAMLEETILDIAQAKSNGKRVKIEKREALLPPKRSGLFIQPQAKYDAYVVTIGSGRGDNFWCALFPKICFPDEEAIEDVAIEDEEEKVTFFIWEWIKGIFS